MATETRKVLGQVNVGASSLTPIYTVPALTEAVVSSIVVCNTSATPSTFRVSVAVAGAADNAKQYIYHETSIPGNETFVSTTGLTLGPGDIIRGFSTTSTLAFSVFGVEVS